MRAQAGGMLKRNLPARWLRVLARWVFGLLSAGAAACDLSEVTVAVPAEIVIVEAYVAVRDDDVHLTAFLHRTVGASAEPVPGARVTVRPSEGALIALTETALDECVLVRERVAVPGTCYGADSVAAGRIQPGDRLTLAVDLEDGSHMDGVARLTQSINLLQPAELDADGTCYMPPDTQIPLLWTKARDAWAYLSEARITGIKGKRKLDLFGLAVSAADTTIVFPANFGLFDRFDLEQDIAQQLQKGLPAGAKAVVLVGSAERNYVNWARGGNFNPSGLVRVPSVFGDGTGVFAGVVERRFRVTTDRGADQKIPTCDGARR